jgi:hypothetical protein
VQDFHLQLKVVISFLRGQLINHDTQPTLLHIRSNPDHPQKRVTNNHTLNIGASVCKVKQSKRSRCRSVDWVNRFAAISPLRLVACRTTFRLLNHHGVNPSKSRRSEIRSIWTLP